MVRVLDTRQVAYQPVSTEHKAKGRKDPAYISLVGMAHFSCLFHSYSREAGAHKTAIEDNWSGFIYRPITHALLSPNQQCQCCIKG